MRLPLGRWLVTGIISLGSAGALAADTKTPFPPCTTAPTEADRKALTLRFRCSVGQTLERTTGFETATPTLARGLRSSTSDRLGSPWQVTLRVNAPAEVVHLTLRRE